MKIQYLGTAAAEGIPALFCDCEVCRNARKIRGKEVKTRSQALIDDSILVDFPADTYMHVLNNGIRLDKIHTLIVTHSHSDHFYPQDFWCRSPGIGNNIEEKPLDVYVTAPGYAAAEEFMAANNVPAERVALHRIEAFSPFESEGYRFIPLKADHDQKTEPVFYIVEHGKKTMLYAHDTGYFPDEVWEFLAKYKRRFDFVSLDCTGMLLPNYRHGHMGLSLCGEVYERLTEMGLCDKDTKACINHFSHNGLATHDELVEEAEKYGFLTSYDGCEIEF